MGRIFDLVEHSVWVGIQYIQIPWFYRVKTRRVPEGIFPSLCDLSNRVNLPPEYQLMLFLTGLKPELPVLVCTQNLININHIYILARQQGDVFNSIYYHNPLNVYPSRPSVTNKSTKDSVWNFWKSNSQKSAAFKP